MAANKIGSAFSTFNEGNHTVNTVSVTVPSGSKYLAIFIHAGQNGSVPDVSSVTVNGSSTGVNAVSGVDSGSLNYSAFARLYGFELVEPTITGSPYDVVVTFASTVVVSKVTVQAYEGVDTDAPSEGGFSTGVESDGSLTESAAPTTTTVNGDVLFGGIMIPGTEGLAFITDTELSSSYYGNNGWTFDVGEDECTGSGETLDFEKDQFQTWSAAVWVIKAAIFPEFTVQPTTQSTTENGTVTFSATVPNAASYQWETTDADAESWGNVTGGSGGTTDSYTTPTLTRASDNGRQYRLKATNASGDTYSNIVEARIPALVTSYSGIGLVTGASDSFTGEAMVGGPITTVTDDELLPSLFTNTSTFFGPTISLQTYDITPSLFTNTNTIYGPVLDAYVEILPALFTNTNTFFNPTLDILTYDIEPSLLTNTNTFFDPILDANYDITPALYTNTNTFFNATLSLQTYDISPALFTNNNAFFNATVSSLTQILPSLFSNTNEFFTHVIGEGAVAIQPALFTNTSIIYAPVINEGYAIQPNLLNNVNQFFSPILLALYELEPVLFTNTSTFFDSVIIETYDIEPPLLNNNNTFFAVQLEAQYDIVPPLLTNDNTFFDPELVEGSISLSPVLLNNQNVFFGVVISRGQVVLSPPLITSGNVFFNPILDIYYEIDSPFFENENTFFNSQIGAGNATINPALFTNVNIFNSLILHQGYFYTMPPAGGSDFKPLKEQAQFRPIEDDTLRSD